MTLCLPSAEDRRHSGVQAHFGREQIRVLEPVPARRRDRAAILVQGAVVFRPELEGRMHIVEHDDSGGLQQASRVGGGIAGALAAASAIENQQVERRVMLDQAPIAVQDSNVWKIRKDRLAGRGARCVDLHAYEPGIRSDGGTGSVEGAKKVGALVADRAKAAGVSKVVFDRGGFIYHGRIAAAADAAREAGLEF